MKELFLCACLFIGCYSSTLAEEVRIVNAQPDKKQLTDLIVNGSFESDMDSDGDPDFWNIRSPARQDCTEAFFGNCSLLLPGGAVRKAKQKFK